MTRIRFGAIAIALLALLAAAACSDDGGRDAADSPAEKPPAGQEKPPAGAPPSGAGTGAQTGGSSGAKPGDQAPGGQPAAKPPEQPAAPTVETQAKAAVQALKAKDMKKLAAIVHPDKGVRFSPYGHIDVKSDRVFKPAEVEKLPADKTVYEWGTFDGSGEPIKLTFADYYAKFVYDADFAEPHKTSVNAPIGKNTLNNNVSDVYPADRCSYVEYHFTGFDQKNEGLDWKSLRLVFEKTGDKLYLVGIVHDQWTT